ncbi:uncharacterized protein LOC106666192 [Cimex lectularius]|uniref:Cilia- and flagella-associated protein 47 domain-containing protein n=1 Tax=Cimex lectularius TaxID=79782 RepID=A0A8I6RPD4_CIMLE|nr:uncharacterized protein LOC106666192 [Cimex lectularius]
MSDESLHSQKENDQENKDGQRRRSSSENPSENNTSDMNLPPTAVARLTKEYVTNYNIGNMSTAYEYLGLRFIPCVITFNNVYVGQIYTVELCVQNISCNITQFRFKQPFSRSYSINDNGTTKTLAPGLVLTKIITYKCTEGCITDSVITVVVVNEEIHLPIKVFKGEPKVLVIPSSIDFGRLDIGCPYVTKEILIINQGSCVTKGSIDLGKNELGLVVSRKNFQIAPYKRIKIKIQLAGLVVGQHSSEFWVKSAPSHRIEVKVKVVFPYFKALHPNSTGNFTLIDLQGTFPGAKRYETLIVRNVSSFDGVFVTSAEANDSIISLKEAEEIDQSFKSFSVYPKEGNLLPFEGRIFTIWFDPKFVEQQKGWISEQRTEQYLVFVRIQRVDVMFGAHKGEFEENSDVGNQLPIVEENNVTDDEVPLAEQKSLTKYHTDEGVELEKDSETMMIDDGSIRLCLYGVGVQPTLKIVPNELIFENVLPGTEHNKVLTLTNMSTGLSMGFRYFKIPSIEVKPNFLFLKYKQSVEVLVTLIPGNLNLKNKSLIFELLSHANHTDKTNTIVVGHAKVKLNIHAVTPAIQPQPKINEGLTPKLFVEAGSHVEMIKYNSPIKFPKSLVIPPSETRPWLNSEARIVLPNEMGRIRPLSSDKTARTIFTGLPRYLKPPNWNYRRTQKEEEFRNKEIKLWRDYFTKTGEKAKQVIKNKEPSPIEEYSVTNLKLYNMIGMMPPIEEEERSISICQNKTVKELYVPDLNCPLVPMHLFNIKVKPKEIDFGKIPPGVDCKSYIVIENLNPFDISVKLFFIKDSQHAPPTAFIVKAMETTQKDIVINLDTLGMHFSNMYYIINTHHRFDLKVAAEVVQRTLELQPPELTMYETQYSDIFLKTWAPIKIVNPLGVPTKFRWKISHPCPFYITPNCGIVPGNGVITCSVYFQFKDRYSLGTVATFLIDKGVQVQYPINYIIDTTSSLSIFMPKISCPNIPLGLPYKKKVIIFNHGSVDCYFSLTNPNPLKGVTISPIAGILKAKAGFLLEISFKMLNITSFDFRTDIETEGDTCIQLKVNGYVVYPGVTFKPTKIIFKGGPCNSFTTIPLTIENQSLAEIRLTFPLHDFPQMKIAKTNKSFDEGVGDDPVVIDANETLKLYLHFEPKDLAAYQFILPYVVNGTIGPPLLEHPETWSPVHFIRPVARSLGTIKNKLPGMDFPKALTCVNIHSTSVRGQISCSKKEMHFFKPPQCESNTITSLWQTVDITCLAKQEVTVVLQLFDTKHYRPFSVMLVGIKKENILNIPIIIQPMEVKTIAVSFTPPHPGAFEEELSVTVKEHNEKRPYCFLKLNGIFHKSTLYCSESLLHFMPVPVGIEIQKTITIIANYQCKNSLLKHSIIGLQGENNDRVLTLVYPNTNEIVKDKENFEIPVQIKFISSRPATYSGYIIFSDGSDGESRIGFTVTADISLLTTYAYYYLTEIGDLRAYEAEYNFVSVEVYGIVGSASELAHPTSMLELPVASVSRFNIDQSKQSDIADYPLFPMSSSETNFAIMMRKTVTATEDWLFEQGFGGIYRMIIGDHMAFSKHYQTAVHSRSKNPYYSVVKSLLDLVLRYAGREFHAQYIIPPSVPADDDGRIMYCLTAYKQIIKFLKTQGAFISHIFPVYLLDYDDYVYYYTKLMQPSDKVNEYMVFPAKPMLRADIFTRYSIQSWLDILLQVYKVLVLAPTVQLRTNSDLFIEPYCTVGTEEHEDKELQKQIIENMKFTKLPDIKINSHSDFVGIAPFEQYGEKCLLKWLNVIFEKKRTKWLSLNPKLKLPPRKVKNFTTDLRDAVVLITVTAYYCPYLTSEFFNNVFFDPTDPSQYQHNACMLTLAWVSIHLGLSISARDFRSPNPMLMIFVVGHLFSVLRSYVPETVLQFSTCLNSIMQRKFHITNPSTQTIGYYIKKIGDPNNLFSFSPHKNVVLVHGKDTTVVTIKYSSRMMRKVKATLLFCGCGQLGAFAINFALTVEGEAKKFHVKNFFKIHTPLFKVATINVGILSPFSTAGMFDIWYSEEEPKPGVKLSMRPWKEIKHQTIPRCLYLNNDRIELLPIHSAKPSLLSLVTAAYTMKVKEFYLFFRNPTIGDFITKIHIIPRVEMPFYTVSVPFMTAPCAGVPDVMCVAQCPRLVMISLPARNNKFWSTANTMLSLTMNKRDKAFWSSYVEKPIGLKLIKWLLSKSNNPIAGEIDFIFNQSVTFNVKSECPYIEFPPIFTIADVMSDGTVDFPIHLKENIESSFSAYLKLTSENGKEIRLYNIMVTKSSISIEKQDFVKSFSKVGSEDVSQIKSET